MTLETCLFYLFSFGAIAFAVGVISARSALYSLLSLVGVMGMTSALFILLKAYLVATILLLVYAGAVLVLFLFAVMMVDFRQTTEGWFQKGKGSLPRVLAALAVAGAVFVQIVSVIGRSVSGFSHAPALAGNSEAIGRVLFGRYLLPFELTSFILLAGVVSVVVLARKESQ